MSTQREIFPGVFIEETPDGPVINVYILDMLEFVGWEDTETNRDLMTDVAQRAVERALPQIIIERVERQREKKGSKPWVMN